MDGAHTHGQGPGGLGELVVLAFGVVLAADVLARVITVLLVVLAVGGGVLVAGLVGYVVLACRRYQQQERWLNTAPQVWPGVPDDPPRAVNADPVTLRQAITELQAQLLATRAGLPVADGRNISICTCTASPPSRPPPSSPNCKPSSTLTAAGRTEGANDRTHHLGRPARQPHHS
jgi:hypothetical protein